MAGNCTSLAFFTDVIVCAVCAVVTVRMHRVKTHLAGKADAQEQYT
jgi:hypothetical protein